MAHTVWNKRIWSSYSRRKKKLFRVTNCVKISNLVQWLIFIWPKHLKFWYFVMYII